MVTAAGESLSLPLWMPVKSAPESGGNQCEDVLWLFMHQINSALLRHGATSGQISSIQIVGKCVCARCTLNVVLSRES